MKNIMFDIVVYEIQVSCKNVTYPGKECSSLKLQAVAKLTLPRTDFSGFYSKVKRCNATKY